MQYEIILASASPRRRDLLKQAGVAFSVQVADVDETLSPADLACPEEACKKLAERKAQAVVEQLLAAGRKEPFAVIGSDTMVVCDGEIFGKPESDDHAFQMLSRLAGRTHEVMTSVCLWMVPGETQGAAQEIRAFVDISKVTFKALTSQDIWDYVAVGESSDKAGAYAIQGAGARLVEGVQGSMDTVIGLPAKRLLPLLPPLADVSGSSS